MAAKKTEIMGDGQTVALSFCFALTGFGVALPGAVLPALLTHWHLQDRGGGLLFLLAWLGSTGGAMLAQGHQLHSVIRGALLTCGASLALALAPQPWIDPAMLAYGIGLGITMTSVSVLRAQHAELAMTQDTYLVLEGTQQKKHSASHEMNRLNMLWALGALSCPALATHALRSGSPGPLLVAVGLVFGFAGVAIHLTGQQSRTAVRGVRQVTMELDPSVAREAGSHVSAARLPRVPIAFALFAALTVGVESALGGWLTTYTGRSQHGISLEVTVASAFWAGLLLSRAWHTSGFVAAADGDRWLQIHAVLTLLSVPLIAIAHGRMQLFFFSLAAGFGLGPIYPMVLAYVLPRYRGRLIFVLAGVGSAFFPWATGALSTELHSIREALLVCCAASLGIAALSFALRPTMLANATRPRSA